jgi:hypothetical protein
VNYTTRLIRLGFAAAPVLAMCAIGMVLLYVGVLYPDFNWRLIDRIHVDLDAAAALFFIAAAAYAGSAWGARPRAPMVFDCEGLDLETIERELRNPSPLIAVPTPTRDVLNAIRDDLGEIRAILDDVHDGMLTESVVVESIDHGVTAATRD